VDSFVFCDAVVCISDFKLLIALFSNQLQRCQSPFDVHLRIYNCLVMSISCGILDASVYRVLLAVQLSMLCIPRQLAPVSLMIRSILFSFEALA